MYIEFINLNAELNQAGLFARPKAKVRIRLNDEGVFINNKKVTDIFYNGCQMRFYISGSHSENEKLKITKDSFYMVFDDNDNDSCLSFEDLHEKVCEAFILSSA